MNIIQLYDDYSIPYLTQGNRHCSEGWVNIHCPFCQGSQDYHLGFPLQGYSFNCYRCGTHSQFNTIETLLHISKSQTIAILKKYEGTSYIAAKKVVKLASKKLKYPSNTINLLKSHKSYLEARHYDSKKLEKQWGLMSCGPASILEGINYSHRIFAPIHWQGFVATFQTRDVTNKHAAKYLACPKLREVHHHKHILYRKPGKLPPVGICVEGITDVWRFGWRAFATFGIKYTQRQVRAMAKDYNRIAVIFDDEPQAINQALKLIADLKARGVESFRVPITGDPGSLSQNEAKQIIKNL